MGITDNDRQIELCFDGTAITTSKRLGLEDFMAACQKKGHRLLLLAYYNIERVGKNRTQHFKIHYKFIGCIALPEVPKPRPIKLTTGQGVAVEYLPSAI